jgi:acyl carrier protein
MSKGVLSMAYPPVNLVRAALGNYLDLNPAEIDATAHLERDLGLEPLDLVLVVFRLEEFADAEFSISDLEGVVTVADFETLVCEWLRDAPVDDVDEDARTERAHVGSGTHVLGSKKMRAAR